LRFRRQLERQRPGDPSTLDEFRRLDERDQGLGEDRDGQQVGACLRIADVTIVNDGTLGELEAKLEAVLAALTP
jgi:hypothetical protein